MPLRLAQLNLFFYVSVMFSLMLGVLNVGALAWGIAEGSTFRYDIIVWADGLLSLSWAICILYLKDKFFDISIVEDEIESKS